MMPLSKRLQAIADLVTPTETVADVGCDHAYLSLYLASRGIVRNAIAMDLRPGPLQRAKEHILREGMGASVETRLGDGLDALAAGEADGIVIAGMGGGVMVHILSRGTAVLSHDPELVLQPQSEIADVRRFLYEIGYEIAMEDMVEEGGKYYPMLKARRSEQDSPKRLSPLEALFGPCLLAHRNETLRRFLLHRQRQIGNLIAQLQEKQRESPGAGRRLPELEEELSLVKEALRAYGEER